MKWEKYFDDMVRLNLFNILLDNYWYLQGSSWASTVQYVVNKGCIKVPGMSNNKIELEGQKIICSQRKYSDSIKRGKKDGKI